MTWTMYDDAGNTEHSCCDIHCNPEESLERVKTPCCEKNSCEKGEQPETIIESKQDFEDLWKRSLAESINLRRRLEIEKLDGIQYANLQFAKELIGSLDNLQRAMKNYGGPEDAFFKGIQLTCEGLIKTFKAFGIEKIADDRGSPFDPNKHQAISEKETTEYPAGTIVECLQEGYVLKDRLLRPALVVIARA